MQLFKDSVNRKNFDKAKNQPLTKILDFDKTRKWRGQEKHSKVSSCLGTMSYTLLIILY